MSQHRVRVLTCNKPLCTNRFFPGNGTAPETILRHEARAAGWTERDGWDYCPNHRPWPGFAAWATAKPRIVVRPAGENPRLRIRALIAALVARQEAADLEDLRTHLPLDDPDRHSLDTVADTAFARIVCPPGGAL